MNKSQVLDLRESTKRLTTACRLYEVSMWVL